MSTQLIVILFAAAVAAFVLYRLYDVLGRRVGRQPGAGPLPANQFKTEDAAKPAEPPLPDVAGLSALKAREPQFDIGKFLDGARDAYQTIVKAFASGDRTALKSLLTSTVDQSFEAAITQRESEG